MTEPSAPTPPPPWERVPASDCEAYAIRARLGVAGSLTSIGAVIVRGDGAFETYLLGPNGLTTTELVVNSTLSEALSDAELTLRGLGWDIGAIVRDRARLN